MKQRISNILYSVIGIGMVMFCALYTECSAYELFGMAVGPVTGDADQIIVETTGAEYTLTRTALRMVRTIDPATNTLNAREVAELTFNADLGPLSIDPSSNTSSATITSDNAIFTFMSDSLIIITARTPMSYTHTNLIADPPWSKGEGYDKMWTDGYGGSLHAMIGIPPIILNDQDNSTEFLMLTGRQMAHMVFPTKRFDFESLYGTNARPFVHFVKDNGNDNLIDDIDFVMNNMGMFRDEGFGVFMIWASLYDYPEIEDYTSDIPVLLDSGVMGYRFKDPGLIHSFVSMAHAYGFKVIPYLSTPSSSRWNNPETNLHQDIETTLEWMRSFQAEFNFNGWYFDNANAGGFDNDYHFIRQVRTDITGEGIIYHHDSVDIWGSWSGRRAVMIDTYVNYTLTGETGVDARIADPNDVYIRFFSSGYGISQAYGDHKRESKMRLPISEGEKNRVIAENLNGVIRTKSDDWDTYFKPAYDQRKTEFLSGSFNPNVSWPINGDTGWFRRPENITITNNTLEPFTISWQTSEASTSELTWTSNGVWWDVADWQIEDLGYEDGPDGSYTDERLSTYHEVHIPEVIAGTEYQFRIRSRTRGEVSDEIIWGDVTDKMTVQYIPLNTDDPTTVPDDTIAVNIYLNTNSISRTGILYVTGDTEAGASLEVITLLNEYNKPINAVNSREINLDAEGRIRGRILVENIIKEYPFTGGIQLYVRVSKDNKIGENSTELTSVKAEQNSLVCYNNLFNPADGELVTIVAEVTQASEVKLIIYDTQGRQVKKFIDGNMRPGVYTYYWDGRDDHGDIISSGMYFTYLKTNNYKQTKKIIAVK
ncbi:MAG: FlgD immunoglobulin-like domain containing protein [bacterium]